MFWLLLFIQLLSVVILSYSRFCVKLSVLQQIQRWSWTEDTHFLFVKNILWIFFKVSKLLRICYRSYWPLLSHAIPSFTTAQVSWSRAFSHCGPHSGRMVNGWAVATQEKNRGFPEERNSLMHHVLHHIWEREQKSQDSWWPLHRFLIQVLKTENLTTISTWPKCPAFLSRYLPVGHDWAMP